MYRDYSDEFTSSGKGKLDFKEQQLFLSKPVEHKEGHVLCLACDHKCDLEPGEWGTCRTRYNDNGTLRSLNYGRANSIRMDQMEKKPLYHFYPDTGILSLGNVGCNAHCEWCHNYASTQIEDMDRGVRKMRDVNPDALVKICKREGIKSMGFTYNEPSINMEFIIETFKVAKANGINTVLVTNGYMSAEALKLVMPHLDAANVDLKSYREETYNEFTGLHLSPIKMRIKTMFKAGIHVEVTTLLIPNVNDSDDELTELATWLAGVSPDIPLHITAYRPCNRFTEDRTRSEDLVRAFKIAKGAGLNYVYCGNIYRFIPELADTEATFCAQCHAKVIDRESRQIFQLWKTPGKCHQCGAAIYGRWPDAMDASPSAHAQLKSHQGLRW